MFPQAPEPREFARETLDVAVRRIDGRQLEAVYRDRQQSRAEIVLSRETLPDDLGLPAAQNTDTVFALAAVSRRVIARGSELPSWELPVGHPDLLQADHVRLAFGQPAQDNIAASPERR